VNEQLDTSKDYMGLLSARMARIEEIIDNLEASVSASVDDQFVEQVYRLMGAYRGVALAAAAWVDPAKDIDWQQWREECFA